MAVLTWLGKNVNIRCKDVTISLRAPAMTASAAFTKNIQNHSRIRSIHPIVKSVQAQPHPKLGQASCVWITWTVFTQ